MLNFDLADTVAGQELFQAGYERGLQRGRLQAKLIGELEKARKEVMEALEDRFDKVYDIGKDIFETGVQEGIKEGVWKGIVQGKPQGELQRAQKDVVAILEIRFGKVSPDVSKVIHELVNLSRIDTLFKQAVLVGSMDEFIETLHQTKVE
ncbi:MAG: hypothetical protein HQK59_05120 [Deltaproteobacteria bacterium]|nr:hypothetical protein [Deltaproteobacteria bacterium]MBF0524960.1 hypothetical protein [Deltaproteobacteria bacterium]